MTGPHDPQNDLLIEEEMKDSYLTYAMSVIVSRALPDIRDGLKPSQRRILVAMRDLNLVPRGRRAKCAAIVGETMKKYHPHGDSAIYPTLVRMGQYFNTRYLLVEPQGNFGSPDGDPPAAMRYTEARFNDPAMYLLEDLDKDTVDFDRNFDDSTDEPQILPGRFPNLICNGSTGIAVGMATNIPPHNLREVCDAIVHLLDNPDCTIDDLMEFIPGPDFPTGSIICGRGGIVQAYKTGRGRMVVRARVQIEEAKKDKKQIVVIEVPYQVNKASIIEKIADGVKGGSITGVADIWDESARGEIRLVIDLKKGENPDVILNQLYKHTQLQDSYSIIMLAIDNKRPRLATLKDLLCAYRDHRVEVIRRRTRFLLDKAERRLHIVFGLLKALVSIDEIIATIKASQTVAEARENLITRFEFSEVQAQAILEMRLQKLTGLEKLELEKEQQKLEEDIAGYQQILSSEALVLDIIREDLFELKEKFGDARKTEISGSVEDIINEELIPEEDMTVTMSHAGYLKRVPLSTYRAQGRGGRGIIGGDAKDGDFVERLFIACTHDYVLFFTNQGRVHWRKVYELPQLSRTAVGRAVVNVLQLDPDETVQSMMTVRDFDDRYLVFATAHGTVKRTALSDFSRPKKGGIRAINLAENDILVGVCLSSGSNEVVLGTRMGMAIRFKETEMRVMGRVAVGVRGIKLAEGDKVIGVAVMEEGSSLLTVCENGYGKRTNIDEYRLQGRGGSGVINIRTTERNGQVVALLEARDGDEIMILTQFGQVVRISVDPLRSIGRATQGVRLIRVDEEDKVVAVARVPRVDGDVDEEGDGHVASPDGPVAPIAGGLDGESDGGPVVDDASAGRNGDDVGEDDGGAGEAGPDLEKE